MMRKILTLLGLAFLTACSSEGREDTQFQQAISRFAPQEFTARFNFLVQTGAPQLEVAYVRSKQSGAILLEHQRGDFDYWLSSDEVQLILQKGLIHGTRGIGEGLLAAELSQPLYHILNLKSGHSDRFHTYLNGNDKAVTRTYRCQIDVSDQVPLVIGEKTAQTRFVTESCNSLDPRVQN